MTFDEYQVATRDTAIYPMAGSGAQIAIAYCGLGLGEAGEVQNKIKKLLRDGKLDKIKLLEEVGDVLWYLARLTDELKANFRDVAEQNLEKLQDRKVRGVLHGSGDRR